MSFGVPDYPLNAGDGRRDTSQSRPVLIGLAPVLKLHVFVDLNILSNVPEQRLGGSLCSQ